MKCRNCDADLSEGTVKCPFCKELLTAADNPMFDNFNFKYTITSEEQLKIIRDAANGGGAPFATALKKKPKLKNRRKLAFRKKGKKTKSEQTKKKASKFAKLSPQNKMYVAFYGSILLLAVIFAGIFFGIGAVVNRERVINPIVYSKDNSIYLVCDKKNVLLTENAIDVNSAFPALGGEEHKLPEILKKSGLIKNSENGMYTYYFENYDVESNAGSLNRIFNGKDKKPVSNGVHNSYILSPDGKSVLFLQSADKNGDMGSLCYWNAEMQEPKRIAGDIDKNTFTFSADGRYILYIRNYNHNAFGGDLCVFDTKKSEEESLMIDSEVYAVFGSDISERKFIYAKGYDDKTKTYDLYIKSGKAEKVKLFEKAAKKPLIPKKGNTLVTYAYGDGRLYSLYGINLKNFNKTKLASQVSEVIDTDSKNKTLMYNKVYDNYITDCYLYSGAQKSVKAADNIVPVSDKFSGVNQFSYSEDFSAAVYISGFDEGRGGGTLYMIDLTKETDNTVEISSDVYMCRISADGKKVIYAKDYSPERDIFDLYAYSKNKSELLKEEADAAYFGVSKDRENYFSMENYDMTGPYGTLNIFTTDNKNIASYGNVWAFDRYGDSGSIFFTDYAAADETWTVHINDGKSKKDRIIGSGINAVLYY